MSEMTKADVETRPEQIYHAPGDHERMTHYVDRRVWNLTEAAIEGTEVQAQCGRMFVPNRDPRFPVCPECQAIVDYRSVD